MATILTNAAIEVINHFNREEYDAIARKMEYNVVLKRVLYPDSVKGIGDVMGYLNNHMRALQPRLADWEESLTPIPAESEQADNATSGQVSGTGVYIDDRGKTRTPIFFTLGFVRKSPGEEWSLINSFSTPTGPTTRT